MDAKRELARRLVDRFHGDGVGGTAEDHFDQVHVRREVPDDVPTTELEPDAEGMVHLPALIAGAFGVSRGEARRLLAQGGVRVDGEPLEAATLDVPAAELAGRILQVGKRRFARLIDA